jgi:hypothetical protein
MDKMGMPSHFLQSLVFGYAILLQVGYILRILEHYAYICRYYVFVLWRFIR